MSVFDGPSRIPLSPFRPPPLSTHIGTIFRIATHPHGRKIPGARRRIPLSLSASLYNPPLSSGNDCQGDMELLSNASARASPHAHMYPIEENDWHKKKKQVQIFLFYHEEVKKLPPNVRPRHPLSDFISVNFLLPNLFSSLGFFPPYSIFPAMGKAI